MTVQFFKINFYEHSSKDWRSSWERSNEDSVQGNRWGTWNGGGMEPSQTQWSPEITRWFTTPLLWGSSPKYSQSWLHYSILHFLDWRWEQNFQLHHWNVHFRDFKRVIILMSLVTKNPLHILMRTMFLIHESLKHLHFICHVHIIADIERNTNEWTSRPLRTGHVRF